MISLKQKIKEINDTPDTTAQFDPEDIRENKGISVLSYISLLVLIPLFARKKSAYARYHCNQGLILGITELCLTVALRFLTGIPYVRWTIYPVCAAVGIAAAALMVLGIVNCAQGRAKELPVLGEFRILKFSLPQRE